MEKKIWWLVQEELIANRNPDNRGLSTHHLPYHSPWGEKGKGERAKGTSISLKFSDPQDDGIGECTWKALLKHHCLLICGKKEFSYWSSNGCCSLPKQSSPHSFPWIKLLFVCVVQKLDYPHISVVGYMKTQDIFLLHHPVCFPINLKFCISFSSHILFFMTRVFGDIYFIQYSVSLMLFGCDSWDVRENSAKLRMKS